MPRVVVLGTSGAGKSTVAAALAALHGMPHVDLDDLAADGNFQARVNAILQTPEWIIDGDFQQALGDSVLSAAELAVWLDLPLRVSLTRMWKRTLRHCLAREPMLLRWVLHEIRGHLRRRRRMRARLRRYEMLKVVHLRSQTEVDDWLADQRGRHEAVTVA